MTFAESVRRFVLGPTAPESDGDDQETPALPTARAMAAETGNAHVLRSAEARFGTLEEPGQTVPADVELASATPGFADIEAAVRMVEAGSASRVVIAGFPSWPGLLWRAYQLAEQADVLILPTVVRPGGHVDIVVTRDRQDE